MTDPDTQQFDADLAREGELYGQMLELSRRQLEAAEGSDPAVLTEIVGRKNELMQDLAVLAEQTAERKKVWPETRSGVPEALRDRIDERLNSQRDLLEQIISFDDRTRQLMAGLQEEVGRSLRQVQGSRTAAQAYKQNMPPQTPRFTDSES